MKKLRWLLGFIDAPSVTSPPTFAVR